MLSQMLDKTDGAWIFASLSLGIFLLFFFGVGLYVFTANKEHIKRMSELPLKNESESKNEMS
jgi:cbb3-type cytochrome oxidase subunit 3